MCLQMSVHSIWNLTHTEITGIFHSCFFVSVENKIKAGQLELIQALMEVMLVNRADANVSEWCAGTLWNVCENGVCIVNELAHV